MPDLKDENAETKELRTQLEKDYGKIWTTDEATAEFDFIGFLAPAVTVVHKATNKKGCLLFTHSPRFYYDFTEFK